jgi:hypothetical protein
MLCRFFYPNQLLSTQEFTQFNLWTPIEIIIPQKLFNAICAASILKPTTSFRNGPFMQNVSAITPDHIRKPVIGFSRSGTFGSEIE